jgi:hypothetical protein
MRRNNPSLRHTEIVITGLDPVIHLLRKPFDEGLMDARIKSDQGRA